ncbi:MAG: hypothetical protein JXB88_07320 [Spirochaetales bacterium]|nr:hypothetical protein [Spirochaetales bacterium]
MFTNPFFYLFIVSVLLNIFLYFKRRRDLRDAVEYGSFLTFMHYVISNNKEAIVKLIDEIYALLEPVFNPKNPQFVKFEILNFILFRMHYDDVIDIPDKFIYEYFDYCTELYEEYISSSIDWMKKFEIAKRNDMYISQVVELGITTKQTLPEIAIRLFLSFAGNASNAVSEKDLKVPINKYQSETFLYKGKDCDYLITYIDAIVKKAFSNKQS